MKINKICFLIGNINGNGGTEQVTSLIANGLVDRGFDISVLSCRGDGKLTYHFDNRIKIIYLNEERHRNFLYRKIRTFYDIRKKIYEILFDVVIVVDVYLYLYVYPLSNKKHCKYVAWEHFNYFIENTRGTGIARKLACKKADMIVVLGKKDFLNYTNNEKCKNIMYIYNPVKFQLSYPKINASHRIVAIGRLEKQKGFDRLIKAWQIVENVLPETSDWYVEIYGEGSQKIVLEEMIRNSNLKKISLKGYCSEVEKILEDSSIFVLSSRYEGFVLVLIEALAKGLPCISFNCKEGPDELIHDNSNGYLIKDGDIVGFSEKLLKMIEDDELRKSFSIHTHDGLERFEIGSVLEQWELLFKDLE